MFIKYPLAKLVWWKKRIFYLFENVLHLTTRIGLSAVGLELGLFPFTMFISTEEAVRDDHEILEED